MRRLPVYILLDCSESMVGEAVDSVQHGLDALLQQLRSDPHALETAWVSIITFSNEAQQVVPLTELTEWANRHGLVTWGITGFDGGRLIHMAQHSLHVPVDDMGIVESIHLLLFHRILDAVHEYVHQDRTAEIAAV